MPLIRENARNYSLRPRVVGGEALSPRGGSARIKEVLMETQIERRSVLGNLAGVLVALPAGLFLVSCGEGNEAPNGDNPAAAPQKSGAQIIYTSSTNDEHSHTFALDTSALMQPPTNGVSGNTSNNSGHTHTVSISADQLQSVNTGESVKVTTSSSGHTHVFTFVKV